MTIAVKIGVRLFTVAALAAGLSACISDNAAFVRSVWPTADAGPAKLSVYYVTDRAMDADMPGGFGTHWSDQASCGVARASVPPAGPGLADATLIAGSAVACAASGGAMSGIVAAIASEAGRRHCNSVLLYVHGFNTAFYSAVARAGQLALDTRFGCVAAAFSWSSEGNRKRYIPDLEHSVYAQPLLEALLRDLAAYGLRVDIVAHSMGNRLVLTTLSSLAKRPAPPQPFIDQLILAAADVGVEQGNDDFLHLLQNAAPFARRTTIYASAGDSVLVVSKRAHGNVARAGREPGRDRRYQSADADHAIDVVDASDAPGDVLGHSYFALSYEMVSDMGRTLQGAPIAQRLTAAGDLPATLVCANGAAAPCQDSAYALKVEDARKPDLTSRLIRWLVPLIPSL